MSNHHFSFKQFTLYQDKCAMKITTDACLFGAVMAATVPAKKPNFRVLDIGAGTGLLSLQYAQKNETASIEAVEIDADAAAQCTSNMAASPWADRLRVTHADILQHQFVQPFGLILCNPPFYENELSSANPKRNTALHSTRLTLQQLAGVLQKNLAADGLFGLLLPHKRTAECCGLLRQAGLFVHQKIYMHPTTAQAAFRTILLGGARQWPVATPTHIHIKEEGSYTPEFIAHLAAYYLAL